MAGVDFLCHPICIPNGGWIGQPLVIAILAAWLLTSRQATGVDLVPLEVRFPHAAPVDTSEHSSVFGCPLKFGRSRSELVLSRKLVDLPLLKADPVLQAIVEGQVVALLAKLPKAEATTDAVRRELALRHLAERRLAIGEIAFLLGFSEVSAFHRAVKQWTGHAPHAYRGSQHSIAGS